MAGMTGRLGEIDALVIETIGFTDQSWLLKSGYMHGFGMKVTERLTRPTFNTMRWEATVEDPEYLAQPFWTSTHFKKQNDASGWKPTPCLAR